MCVTRCLLAAGRARPVRRGALWRDAGAAGMDGRSASAFELLPHLAVALVRPDARMIVPGGLVVGARYVKWHAVVEDHPVAVARPHEVVYLAVDGFQVFAIGHAPEHCGVQVGQEGTRARQPL